MPAHAEHTASHKDNKTKQESEIIIDLKSFGLSFVVRVLQICR